MRRRIYYNDLLPQERDLYSLKSAIAKAIAIAAETTATAAVAATVAATSTTKTTCRFENVAA